MLWDRSRRTAFVLSCWPLSCAYWRPRCLRFAALAEPPYENTQFCNGPACWWRRSCGTHARRSQGEAGGGHAHAGRAQGGRRCAGRAGSGHARAGRAQGLPVCRPSSLRSRAAGVLAELNPVTGVLVKLAAAAGAGSTRTGQRGCMMRAASWWPARMRDCTNSWAQANASAAAVRARRAVQGRGKRRSSGGEARRPGAWQAPWQ